MPQTVIGIAGASADSDELWQIGVDVLPKYQGRCIGKALVSELTAAVLAAGKVPTLNSQRRADSGFGSIQIASARVRW